MISPELMRLFLYATLFAMLLLAVSFLKRRRISDKEFILWGLLALLLPVLGPYLVILYRPGRP